MASLKNLFSDCEFRELKNYLIKDIVVIDVIDNFVRERMLREWNLTLEKAIALGKSTEQTKIRKKELKQEAEIYRIKFNKKEIRYLQLCISLNLQ